MSILLSVCFVLLSGRKHVSNLCMAEGSANTKVVLYCWAHHCQVLTSQGITESITEPPNFPLFTTSTAKAIYSQHIQTISSASSDLYIYMCVYIGSQIWVNCSSVHVSLALWPSKSLQGKTMFY